MIVGISCEISISGVLRRLSHSWRGGRTETIITLRWETGYFMFHVSLRDIKDYFLYQDSSTTTTMDLNNQDQDTLTWTPAKASNVKQSKSVTFKDC